MKRKDKRGILKRGVCDGRWNFEERMGLEANAIADIHRLLEVPF